MNKEEKLVCRRGKKHKKRNVRKREKTTKGKMKIQGKIRQNNKSEHRENKH